MTLPDQDKNPTPVPPRSGGWAGLAAAVVLASVAGVITRDSMTIVEVFLAALYLLRR